MGGEGWLAFAQGAQDMGGVIQSHRSRMISQHDAQDFSREMFMNRYTYMVDDLKRAGLNPMLAYQNSAGSAPSGSPASPGSSGGRSVVDAFNSSRIASATEANLTADTQQKMAQARATAATERKTDAETLVQLGMPPLIAAQVSQATASAAQAEAMTQKIRLEMTKVSTEIKSLESQIAKNRSDVSLNKSLEVANEYANILKSAETFLTNARTRNTALEGDILVPKAKAAKGHSGQAAAEAENQSKINRSFDELKPSPFGWLPNPGFVPK